jgi:hypothetical protein
MIGRAHGSQEADWDGQLAEHWQACLYSPVLYTQTKMRLTPVVRVQLRWKQRVQQRTTHEPRR